MISKNISSIIKDSLDVKNSKIKITNEKIFRSKTIDGLIWEAVFGKEEDLKSARWVIWESSLNLGITPCSIHDIYIARGNEKLPLNFTVPAMNLRGMAYDMARSVFKTCKKLNVGTFILELARSEMGYTDQPPEEYVTVCLAGAIKEGWNRPIFIQGDHFQTKKDSPGKPKEGEIEIIKSLMIEAINAGFYNIDIDTSTLVDLDKPTEEKQQESNIKYSVDFAKHIRKNEPKGVTVSLGGEIGHIGGVNSTADDLIAYMNGFNTDFGKKYPGMSKISVQTGTHHGGVVLPDGNLADVDVDFNVLREITKICRDKYKISGAVQHGASTLPDKYFNQFVKAEAIEVHLATGFQNIIFDHDLFPKELRKEIYKWLDENKSDEKKEGQTDEQFHYKLRKKAWGQFKKQCWQIDESSKKLIRDALENRFEFMFNELNVQNTFSIVDKWIKPVQIHKKLTDFGNASVTKKQIRGLSD